MSKILTKQEAEKIVKLMLEPMGFTVTVLDHSEYEENHEAYRACNIITSSKQVGYLWWKKTVKTEKLVPIWTGWCWEEVLEKMDNWIKTKAVPRVNLADQLRDKYAMEEAAAALDEELRK